MISASYRFHGRGAIQGVYAKGKTVRAAWITLKCSDRPARKQRYRVAVVVSRKVHKSAVVRNRVRRRVYEIVRQSDEELLFNKDLVFTVFSDQAATVDHQELAKIVRGLLKKAVATSVTGV